MAEHQVVFTKDLEKKILTVVRAFAAPLGKVWKAWTTDNILDQWWAPKPYRAETKTMDFREGGQWLYGMVGPEGDRSWCRVDYFAIVPNQHISSAVMFCDETGKENLDFPVMRWEQEFSPAGYETIVTVKINFEQAADMEKILQMGFEEGFTAGLVNLDQYLAAH